MIFLFHIPALASPHSLILTSIAPIYTHSLLISTLLSPQMCILNSVWNRWRCVLHVYFTYIFTHSYLSNNSDKLNIDSRSWKTRNRDFSSSYSSYFSCSILPFNIQKKKMMKILFSHDHITVKWTKKNV